MKTDERVATSWASQYRPYRTKPLSASGVTTWVQIDLGASHAIASVKLYPFCKPHMPPGDGFPLRFRIECSDVPDFTSRHAIADWTNADYPDVGDHVSEFAARNAPGRYVRLTVTHLRQQKPAPVLLLSMAEASRKQYGELLESTYFLALSKLEVLSSGIDLALGRPVSVDPGHGNLNDAQQLTRPSRPQGEGIVTDHPENITQPETWRPRANRAEVPRRGVVPAAGLFKTALENNARYLVESFSVDELLHPFRQRAGLPFPPTTRALHPFWDGDLPGSNAGRFLMGAGNTLRWIEDDELRSRMNAVVEGIAKCRQPNGYIMAYPENTFFVSERGAYTRAWVTHGLIEAGLAGNTKAFELLRGYYDWYNQMPDLPQALRGCIFGPQGTVANTRVYFTPVGKAVDIQVVQRYLQENYWLQDLAARKTNAVWQYPYDRPHCYLLTFVEAYLDLYRATGESRYLNAVMGAWDLFHDNWQYTGGSIAVQEMEDCPPKASPLHDKRGETCGSAFWILLNQRLHLLFPDEEKYVAEIEKSIYNVLLANQVAGEGIRYHTSLVGSKEKPTRINTCCEGQGTRLLGSLPEFIYSTAEDGLYVNLYEASSITWSHSGVTLRLDQRTGFPGSPHVQLEIHTPKPVRATIRVRVPSWAAGAVRIEVNEKAVTAGTPGSYVPLERTWSDGDQISFVLPIDLRLAHYSGVDQIAGRQRFALEYGPILMAAVSAAGSQIWIERGTTPLELPQLLRPSPDKPLHFSLPFELSSPTVWIPYFEIGDESFDCFPVIKTSAKFL